MTTIRQQRVAELLFEELSIMIGNELDDPRLSLARVTSVNVSRDLRNVSVYVTHDDDEVSTREILQGLRHATPYMRRQLAVRCTLRAVPELTFHYDDTPEKAARVDELLRQIAADRLDNGSAIDAANGKPATPQSPSQSPSQSPTQSPPQSPSKTP